MPSTPTWPTSWRFASCTNALPGPTITSTDCTDSVPNASAAMAWAPPIRYTSVTSHRTHAARITGCALPPGPGGAQTATSRTPATRAVTAPITTVDGYGARPPGTYTTARRTGCSTIATVWPSGSSTVTGSSRTWAFATDLTFAIAVRSPFKTSGSSTPI